MRKFLAVLLALMLLTLSFASAEDAAQLPPEIWYELSGDDTILTVWLSDSADDALRWEFEISNPEALELLTQKVIGTKPEKSVVGDEPEKSVSPMTYAASFLGMAGTENSVSLILKYTAEDAEPPFAARVLEMTTAEDGKITILSILDRRLAADWLEYDSDNRILTVTLPEQSGNGYAWTMSILDPEILELITCDTETGYVGSYKAASAFGNTELTLSYGKTDNDMPEIMYTVNLIVSENGDMELRWAETFTIFTKASVETAE